MNKPRSSNRTSTMQRNSIRTLTAVLSAAGLATLATGCGAGLNGGAGTTGVATAAVRISGNVHGGQQPVSGAAIQLYTVNTSSLKGQSTPLLTSSVQTDAGGNFNITGKYTCTSATQVYLTATGGDPGAGNNSALTLVAALGACSSLTPATFIQVNEVTTIAAAYALAPFAQDITHVGAAGSNPSGLVGAFANAALLANVANGTAGGANLATGVTVPVAEINTLADIIAACVNSTGSASSGCSTLFTATGATETFGGALAIARNPGASANTALYSLASPTAPFQPTLSSGSAPNDFTMAVTTTAGGSLATPYGVAIDASGNAWVTNESGTTVSEISTTGASLANPTASGLYGAQGVALDRNGNVWVANTAGNSVVKFTLTAGAVSLSNVYTSGGIAAPSAIAVDSVNDVFIANFNGNSVTELGANGAALNSSPFTAAGAITVPTGIAVGPTGNVFVTSGNGSVVNLNNAGVYVASLNDGTLQGPSSVAIDSTGRIVASGFAPGSTVVGALSQFTAGGAAVSGSPATNGLGIPAGVATDGTSVFVANSLTSGGLAQFPAGSVVPSSPASGFGSLNSPVGVAVDATGSVWTANSGSNTVSKFIGLAAPVVTPLAANVGP
jgi:sugar lactone lactonase YvrE